METESTRPEEAELIECVVAGMTLKQMAAKYGRSSKQIKRWFKANNIDWRVRSRTEDKWEKLLAGSRFEDVAIRRRA